VADLRIIKNGKSGVSATNKMEKGEISRIVREAEEVAEFGKEANFELPTPTKVTEPKLSDPEVENIKEAELLSAGEKIIDTILSCEPKMRINYLGFTKGSGIEVFLNSNGVKLVEKHSSQGIDLEFGRIKKGDFFQLFIGQESRRKDIDYMKLVEKLLEKARWGRSITKIRGGKYPVIFSPEATSELFGYIATSANGRFVNEKSSKFVGKLGEKIFDEKLTIYEDPTCDWGIDSYALDDEGVAGTRKALIDRGVVANFYYDLAQGAKAKTQSTGNASRRPFAQADPTLSNIFVSGGERKFSELLKEIKEGLIVYQLLGAGQNNPFNGDFQLGINLGYKVEKGEIVGRVKNVAMAGNVFELLRDNLLWLSEETERWGAFTSAYICLGNVVVSSK
jgi:PmbA protein